MSHPSWELLVEGSAALILTPCPGTKKVALLDSLKQLQAQGATVVVTAITQEEMQAKCVSELGDEVEKCGMQWFHLPIEDDCAPDNTFLSAWQAIRQALHAALAAGDKIVLHCMGGSGRTGLLAAHLLSERGWAVDEIVTQVQALRPGAFTKAVQIDYVRQLAQQ